MDRENIEEILKRLGSEAIPADVCKIAEETSGKFKEYVLSKGGTEKPMTLYKKFRGKEPNADALLKRAGLMN